MRIQPRQQLLDIWQATARTSYQGGTWSWGGRDKPNSISDAEQLLCIMFPASEVSSFKLDLPDQTSADVLAALDVLGDSIEIPKVLIRAIGEYLQNYSDQSGAPIFSGGSYFIASDPKEDLTPDQRALDVVDSYSMSVTLMLATLGFIKVFRTVVRRAKLHEELDRVERAASKRLTAAMVGLLRGFTVHAFEARSAAGRVLCRTANQDGRSDDRVAADLRKALSSVRARLREVTIGSGQGEVLDNENLLFECGWSWGVVENAPAIEVSGADIGPQPEGLARVGPYLYFTLNALEGISDLFSERTRVLGLLDPEQQRLARALQIRWDLTQSYWAAIATFGDGGKWPLEDIPWRTTDGQESDYFSLLVTAIVVQDLVRRRAPDADLGRVARILADLAARARVTRRPLRSDPAVGVHSPGLRLTLVGGEKRGPGMAWLISDFAAVLLKRTVAISGLARSTQLRDSLVSLADGVWGHLLDRRMRSSHADGLWDQPHGVFGDLAIRHELPSWYFTERIVEGLVLTAGILSEPPLRSERLIEIATDLLNEADHLYDRELLNGSYEAGPAMRVRLRRAREILQDRPAGATALALETLRELDLLIAARDNAARGDD